MKSFLSRIFTEDDNVLVVQQKNEKFKYHHVKGFDSIEAKITSLTADNHEQGYNIGVVLSSVSDDKVGEFKSIRKEDNFSHCRVFFLDIDLGKTKTSKTVGYLSVQEALDGLDTAIQRKVIPNPTMVVASGGGLHVYWRLTKALDIPTWKMASDNFASNLLQFDPKLVTDFQASRKATVYPKVPGFYNVKRKTITTLVRTTNNIINPAKYVKLTHNNKVSKSDTDNTTKTQSIFDSNDLRKVCKLPTFAVKYPQKVNEPLWMNLACIMPYCHSGEKIFHNISKKHPGYDEEEADRKFETASGYAKQNTKVTCATIAMNSSACGGPCQSCPNLTRNSSPVRLASQHRLKFSKANSTDPMVSLIPEGYFASADHEIVAEIQKPIGNGKYAPEIITINTFLAVCSGIFKEESTGEVVAMFHCFETLTKKWESITIPLAFLADTKAMVSSFNSKGFVIHSDHYKFFKTYCEKSVSLWNGTNKKDIIYQQLGWKSTKEFLLGNRIITDKGVEPTLNVTDELKDITENFQPSGKLDKWKEAFDLFNREGCEPHAIMALSGFAATLMKFGQMNSHGVLLCLASEKSGKGKSAAVSLMQSVYSYPDLKGFVAGDTDSVKFRMRYLASMCNLPVIWDEATEAEPAALGKFVYALSQGNLRRVLTQQSKMRGSDQTIPWNTITCCTTNASMVNKLLSVPRISTAQVARVVEFSVNYAPDIDELEVADALNTVEQNYGIAIEPFLKYAIKHGRLIKKMIAKKREEVTTYKRLTPQLRFWAQFASVWYVAALFAKKAGLHDYDEDALFHYIIKQAVAQGTEMEQEQVDALELLVEFISSVPDKIMTSVRESNGLISKVSKEESFMGNALVSANRPIGEVVGHATLTKVNKTDKASAIHRSFHVSKSAFANFLNINGYNHRDIIKGLVAKRLVKHSRAKLGQCALSTGVMARPVTLMVNFDLPQARASLGYIAVSSVNSMGGVSTKLLDSILTEAKKHDDNVIQFNPR